MSREDGAGTSAGPDAETDSRYVWQAGSPRTQEVSMRRPGFMLALPILLALLPAACALSPALAESAVSAYIVVPAGSGEGSALLERMELDSALAALASGGRVERAGKDWRWSSTSSSPYRVLGRTPLARSGAWELVRVDLEPFRKPGTAYGGARRTVSFTLGELLEAPYGTRSPELHAAFAAVAAYGTRAADLRVEALNWDAKRSRFEATVRFAK